MYNRKIGHDACPLVSESYMWKKQWAIKRLLLGKKVFLGTCIVGTDYNRNIDAKIRYSVLRNKAGVHIIIIIIKVKRHRFRVRKPSTRKGNLNY